MKSVGIEEIAQRKAEKLLLRLKLSADPNERGQLRKQIAQLLASYGQPQIALLLARAIARLILDRGNSAERTALIDEIAGLRHKYASAEIALVEAEVLERECLRATSVEEQEQTLARLTALSTEFSTPEIAAVESGAVYRMILREQEPARRMVLLRRIAEAGARHNDSRIRLTLANALGFVLTAAPDARDRGSLEGAWNELLSLDQSSGFLLEHARALRKAALRTDVRTGRDLADRIAGLFERYPSSEMATVLAEALLYASAAVPASGRIAIAEQIGRLLDRFPSAELAVLQSWALFLSVVADGTDSRRGVLLSGIESVLVSYDCWETATEPAAEFLREVTIEAFADLRQKLQDRIRALRRRHDCLEFEFLEPALTRRLSQPGPAVG